ADLPQLNRFVSEPWFRRVTGLEWSQGRYSPQSLRPLLEAPHAALTELTVHTLALAPDGLRALFEAAVMPNLTRLSLVGNGPQVVRAALESLGCRPTPRRLRSLTIRGNGLNREILVLACRLPGSLRILDLSASGINSAGAQEFAGVKATSELRMLVMSSNHVGNAGGSALFTAPHLSNLQGVNPRYCPVGDDTP